MPRDVLIKILNEKLIFELVTIVVIYFIIELIIFKLNFQMLGIAVRFRRFLPGVLFLILYDIFGKQILPNLVFGLMYIVLLAIIIGLTSRRCVTWIKAFWSSFLSLFISSIGMLIIQIPLSFNPVIPRFITTTPLGVVCGTAIEAIFPLVALFLLKTMDISIIPPVKRRVNLMDTANLTLFAGLFALLYNAFGRTLKYLDVYSKLDLVKDLLNEGFIVALEIGLYRFIYTTNRRKLEEERRRHEEIVKELKTQNLELTKLNETLKTIKVKPIKLVNDIENVINNGLDAITQIKDYYNTLEKSGYIIIQPDKLLEYNLKPNEKTVLEGIMAGKTYQEIGDEMHFVEGSIKNIASQVFKKFGVKNREEMERFIIENLVDKD